MGDEFGLLKSDLNERIASHPLGSGYVILINFNSLCETLVKLGPQSYEKGVE